MPSRNQLYKSWDDPTLGRKDPRNLGVGPSQTLLRKVRKVGEAALKSGTHPQQQMRQVPYPVKILTGPLARLGRAGPLGDDLIFQCRLKPKANTFLKKPYTEEYLADMIVEFIIEPILDWAFEYINVDGFVPIKFGNLRHALFHALTDDPSEPAKFPFQLYVNTRELAKTRPDNVNYPRPTNEMQTANLAHSVDPKAIHHFYNFLIMQGRTFAQKQYQAFLKKLTFRINRHYKRSNQQSSNVLNYNITKSFFSVKYK